MEKYDKFMDETFNDTDEDQMAKFCDSIDKLLGGEGDHQNGETYLKARWAVWHLLDRMIHSSGLRRAISSDLLGDSTNRSIAKNMLYATMLIGHTTRREMNEVYKAIESSRDEYEEE